MRPTSLVLRRSGLHVIGALAVSLTTLSAAPPKFRDAATNEDLINQAKQSANYKPLAKPNPRKVEEGKSQDPTKENPIPDLIATSDFLSARGLSTLIPKRALLHVPKKYQGNIQFVKGSRLVIWPTFYRSNRGWIKTMEVTRAQAQGKENFTEEVIENLAKSSVVVVATYKGGPISVLPYKDPEAPEEGAEGEKEPEKKSEQKPDQKSN